MDVTLMKGAAFSRPRCRQPRSYVFMPITSLTFLLPARA